ncbi:Ig domain-containing protein [Brevibacillus sp. B_LB10_24]|uniref:Ig-like domain-containing protein n=1 Tax=Brevibacillus sp. B_LB10_24 TaxID=3380645 RepID=UPI0038BC0E6E
MGSKGDKQSCFRTFFLSTVIVVLLGTHCFGHAFAADEELQEKWKNRYITEETRELVQTVISAADGGAVVWANQTDYQWNSMPATLLKADADGQKVWTTTVPQGFWISNVKRAKEGGYLIMGALESKPEKLQLIKLTEAGKMEWTKAISVEGGAMTENRLFNYKDFAQTIDGGFVVVGRKFTDGCCQGGDPTTVYIVKISQSGTIEWDKQLGKPAYNTGERVFVTDRGDVYIQGLLSYGDAYLYMAKLNKKGKVIWENTYSGTGTVYSINSTSDDGVVITGNTNRTRPYPVFDDIFALKIDSKGDLEWQKRYGEEKRGEVGVSLSETDNGSYMLIGRIQTETNDASYWSFMKLDHSGNMLWDKPLEFPNVRSVFAAPTENGDYLLLGEYWERNSIGMADKRDIHLVKFGKSKAVLSLVASKHEIKLSKDETRQLELQATYDDGTHETVTDKVNWSSSDELIAVVDDNGQVTGKQKGKAIITATYQGKSAAFSVKVSK